jgi:tetratricopeptide (TPR) repeat protein/ferredoxin
MSSRVELPVLQPVSRKGRSPRRRAVALLLVHLVVALHVGHWMATGRSVTPVEPSEAMYTLELGLVNAGAIFFAITILSTLVVGRFFCGWACHVVALQDLCGWMMRKAGIRPKPFRSRLLVLAPLALALYMFAWPTFERVVLRQGPPFPGFRAHLVTDDFWRTFPGPAFAVLTFLTCGFLAVYVLGSKGFCTYGCPYGAFFAIADRFAPIRIVADGCKQAGQCTPACTSNVLVHAEVRSHAMVVDSGCLKCMDCVDACPNGALSVGLGKPAFLVGPAAASRQEASRLPWSEELLAAAVMLAATLAFRGLYDGPPLLMAVGLGAISAFLALQLLHLARRPTVRLQSLTLKAGGEWSRAGRVVAAITVAWLLFTAHSGFVQWHRWRGTEWLNRTEIPREAVLTGRFDARRASARHVRAEREARRHLATADRFGLVALPEIELGLAWLHLLHGEERLAEARIRDVLGARPSDASRHENLVELLVARGRLPEAADALRAKLLAVGPSAEDRFRLATLLAEAGRFEESLPEMQAAAREAPQSGPVRYNLGALLRRMGRAPEAVTELEAAAALLPGDAQVLAELEAARVQARTAR